MGGDQPSKTTALIPGSERADAPARPRVMPGEGRRSPASLLGTLKSWVAGPSPAMTRKSRSFRGLVSLNRREPRIMAAGVQMPVETVEGHAMLFAEQRHHMLRAIM